MTAHLSYPLFDPSDPVFRAHEGGKLGVHATQPLRDRADLSLLYTPGVADVSRAIAADPPLAARYTAKRHTVAVVTDGTAVLGLGDIGPLAALPVMEGKAVLFKHFAGIDAVPVCMETGTVDELVDAIARIAPTYGGINLEDISAPRCFEIERRLQERLDIPVFHDDQHGTAIVVLAGLINAAKVVGRELESLRVVVSGAGAAGVAVTRLLARAGVGDIVVCDSKGIISPERTDLVEHKHRLAATTNPRGLSGSLADALVGANLRWRLGRPCAGDGHRPHGAGLDHLRAREPRPGGRPCRGGEVCRRCGDGTLGLPEPDQQRAGLPGYLPGGARLGRSADHRSHEACCGPRNRRPGERADGRRGYRQRVRRGCR